MVRKYGENVRTDRLKPVKIKKNKGLLSDNWSLRKADVYLPYQLYYGPD